MKINKFEQLNVKNISSTVSSENTRNVTVKTEQLKINVCDSESVESTNLNESGRVSEEDHGFLKVKDDKKESKKANK